MGSCEETLLLQRMSSFFLNKMLYKGYSLKHIQRFTCSSAKTSHAARNKVRSKVAVRIAIEWPQCGKNDWNINELLWLQDKV